MVSKEDSFFCDNFAKKMANEIAKRYFFKSFATISKSDLEVIFFHYYLEQKKLVKRVGKSHYNNSFADFFINDFEISNELGITQSKVRNLRMKEYILFSRDNNEEKWIDDFIHCLNDKQSYIGYGKSLVRYNPTNRLVEMSIPDVNLILEIRNCLESMGFYDEIVLNKHLFKCPINSFVALCKHIDTKKASPYLEKYSKVLDELDILDVTFEKKILEKLKQDGINILTASANSAFFAFMKLIAIP